MKRSKGVISILLCCLLVLQSACGKTGESSDVIDNGNSSESDPTGSLDETELGGVAQIPQESTQFLRDDWMTSYGDITPAWEKDYTSAEWEDGICLNLCVHEPPAGNTWTEAIEEELNHRLHQAGYNFYFHFEHPDHAEWWRYSDTIDFIRSRQESGMTIDLYMITRDYQTDIENGELLDLTDYLQSEEGRNLYEHFDPGIWRQLETEDGRIYGVPVNPVATTRYAYIYSPQLADVLGVDMTAFAGDAFIFEGVFPGMMEQRVAPITLNCSEDLLMLSLLGLENYEEIFAIRHTEDDWEAVDLFEETEIVSYYEQLGSWKEKGFLFYHPDLIWRLGRLGIPVPSEMNADNFAYLFLCLSEVDRISRFYRYNQADDDRTDMNYYTQRPVESDFYVPQGQAFITENRDSGIFIISADTQYPQECMQFLNLLMTDEELRMLLCCGIENYNYVWENEVEVYDKFGGSADGDTVFGIWWGINQDPRFWPVEYWHNKYETEIEELNRDVIEGISLTVDCDFAGLEEQYEACRQLFEENLLIFLGYYGAETGERLQALHEQLNEAGYQELIAAVNAMHE